MIASTLQLVAALSMAAPVPLDPTQCAASDPGCTARAYAAAANDARSNEERVQYLYFAHRAALATPDLCGAKRLIKEALALPPTPVRKLAERSKRETLGKIAKEGVQCEGPRARKPGAGQRAAFVAAGSRRTPPSEPPPFLAAPEQSSSAPDSRAEPVDLAADMAPSRAVDLATEVASSEAPPELLAPPTPEPELMPIDESRATRPSPALDATRSSSASGRGLLIAGGVSLAAGLALTGTAASIAAQAIGARRTGFAGAEWSASPENMDRDAALRAHYERLGTIGVATGVTGGAALVAAVAMLWVGARRKSRATVRELTLMPVRGGLLFTTRF